MFQVTTPGPMLPCVVAMSSGPNDRTSPTCCRWGPSLKVTILWKNGTIRGLPLLRFFSYQPTFTSKALLSHGSRPLPPRPLKSPPPSTKRSGRSATDAIGGHRKPWATPREAGGVNGGYEIDELWGAVSWLPCVFLLILIGRIFPTTNCQEASIMQVSRH